MTGALLAAALRYASAGWPVFPVRAGAKRPPLTGHGCLDATADPDRVRAWWRRWPDANVAIATGAPGPDVLDVDMREAGSGYPAYNQLRRAGLLSGGQAAVRTPSGGLHVYFPGTRQPCGSLPARFLDFKTAGGYVLAPPSTAGGKPYEPLSYQPGPGGTLDWQAVRDLLGPPEPRMAPAGGMRGSMAGLAAWVAGLAEGNRNNGLFWAACRAAEAGRDPMGLLTPAMVAGLAEAEAVRTIASAARRAGP